jgi:murein tripeptide amidase MpaA
MAGFQAYTYNQYLQEMEESKIEFQSIVTIDTIGTSVMNRPIHRIILGKGKEHIQISGSHHAREWMTSWLCTQLVREYARLYQNDACWNGKAVREMLDRISLVFIPMVNPDGVVLATEGWASAGLMEEEYRMMAERSDIGERYWLWKANIRGVDLNRQYEMNWDQIRNNTIGPAAMNYKGVEPASEPEVKALLNVTRDNPPLAVIAYHSAGEEIYWFHGQSGEQKERDVRLAQVLANCTGYALIPEEEFVAGGYADWFVDQYKRPGFTVEIGREPHPVDLCQAERIWEQNREMPLHLIDNLQVHD